MKQLKKTLRFLRFAFVRPWVDFRDGKLLADMERWRNVAKIGESRRACLLSELLGRYPEFRNLFLYRIRHRRFFSCWVRFFYKPLESLWLEADSIGGGLFIQHGFATIVAAQSIGDNCWINQQVTVGYKDDTFPPRIGDNVTIACGAKVLGDILVGDGATIGANAVVVKDVEPGAVMVGVPAKRIR